MKSEANAILGAHRIRSLHHFGCTGGTIISRCIAALPNTRLLSEVDPLSMIGLDNSFRPTDVIGLGILGTHPVSSSARVAMFQAAIRELLADSRRQGLRLVIRDHAHSHFCVGPRAEDRSSLKEILEGVAPVDGLVTVRHPLESYLSLISNRWVHFEPGSLSEYAVRYNEFLDRHVALPVMQYESFTLNPEKWLQEAAGYLDLRFNPLAIALNSLIRLSGDSGRSGSVIEPRPPRTVPDNLRLEATTSEPYRSLLERLGYAEVGLAGA